MSKDPSDLKKVDEALSDKLHKDLLDCEKEEREGTATTDPDLANQIVEGVEGYFFKKKIQQIHKTLFHDSKS